MAYKDFLIDKRILQRHIDKGLVDAKQYDKLLTTLPDRAVLLPEPSELRLGLDQHVHRIDAGAPDGLLHRLAALHDAVEQVERVDLGVLSLVGEALGSRDHRACVAIVGLEAESQRGHAAGG